MGNGLIRKKVKEMKEKAKTVKLGEKVKIMKKKVKSKVSS